MAATSQLRIDAITIGAPGAPQAGVLASAPYKSTSSEQQQGEAAPAVGVPVHYPPIPQGGADAFESNPMAYDTQPMLAPTSLPVQQQEQQQQQVAPVEKPFGPFKSVVVTDKNGSSVTPCHFLNPFRLIKYTVLLGVGVLQKPCKVLRGDLSTPPCAWTKLPRIKRVAPSAPYVSQPLQLQAPAKGANTSLASAPHYYAPVPQVEGM